MRILVTGGAGFIGSHVVDVLVAKGHAITVLDNLSTGSKSNIETHFSNPDFRFIVGDIRDPEDVRRALEDVDAVVHEAAMVSVPLSIREPALVHEVNVEGTLLLLRASLNAGVRRFVYASTSAVYGNSEQLPVTEDAPLSPLSSYARTKLRAEEECRSFFERGGLPATSLRYFNVYGPRQVAGEYAGVMIKFIERLRGDQPPIIYGTGKQTRDFIYVSDVVEATLLALERDEVVGESVNIGTGKATDIGELCELFLKLTGKTHLKPLYEAPRPSDINQSQADISEARRLLDFEPKVSLAGGVKKLLGSVGVG